MKYKLPLTFALLLFIQSLTAQIDSTRMITPGVTENSDYWMKKARQSRTIGWLLLGAGTVVTTIVSSKNYTGSGSPLDGVAAAGDNAIGMLITIACSTPFFINSTIKKKKARLLLKQEQVTLNLYNKKSLNLYHAGITIDL